MDMTKITEIRNRLLRKEPVSREELAAALEYLRQGRTSAEKKQKPKKQNSEDILAKLLGELK